MDRTGSLREHQHSEADLTVVAMVILGRRDDGTIFRLGLRLLDVQTVVSTPFGVGVSLVFAAGRSLPLLLVLDFFEKEY